MTHLGYLLAGWGVSLGALGAHAVSVMVRGRRLSSQVPAGRARWMTSSSEGDGP